MLLTMALFCTSSPVLKSNIKVKYLTDREGRIYLIRLLYTLLYYVDN